MHITSGKFKFQKIWSHQIKINRSWRKKMALLFDWTHCTVYVIVKLMTSFYEAGFLKD